MNPDSTRLQQLFEKYFDKTATDVERTELSGLLEDEGTREAIMQQFAAGWEKYSGDGTIIAAERSDEMLQTILKKNKDGATVREILPARRLPW